MSKRSAPTKADRAADALRKAADALDEVPTAFRGYGGDYDEIGAVLSGAVSPTLLRAQADRIAKSLADYREAMSS